MPALGTYSSITLGVNLPVPLTPPGPGGYIVAILNNTAGNVYISDLATAGANPTSFKLPAGLYSPTLSARSPLYVASDAGGLISTFCTAAR